MRGSVDLCCRYHGAFEGMHSRLMGKCFRERLGDMKSPQNSPSGQRQESPKIGHSLISAEGLCGHPNYPKNSLSIKLGVTGKKPNYLSN